MTAVEISNKVPSGFEVVTPKRTYHLQALREVDLAYWTGGLIAYMAYLAQSGPSPVSAQTATPPPTATARSPAHAIDIDLGYLVILVLISKLISQYEHQSAN